MFETRDGEGAMGEAHLPHFSLHISFFSFFLKKLEFLGSFNLKVYLRSRFIESKLIQFLQVSSIRPERAEAPSPGQSPWV